MPRDWGQLTGREREQISLMLVSLKEFSYGFDRADEVAAEVLAGCARLRFYMNALYHYCANYFLVGGAHKLRNVVRGLGAADLVEPIEHLLATPLGETNLGEIIRTFRDKFLVHQSFTFAPLEARVHKKFDILESANAERFMALIHELFAATRTLYVELAGRYPLALLGEREEPQGPGSPVC